MTGIRRSADDTRWELDLGEGVAFAVMRREGDGIAILHTEVPAALRGRGNGDRLMKAVLEEAKALGLIVRPVCGFARGYMARNS